MATIIYANTKNSDMFYAVHAEVPDPFFYIDLGEKKYVFLDHREYGVFEEHNQDPSIELVLLNPILDAAAQITDQTSGSNKLAWHLITTYGLAQEVISVPTSFPLDMADYLRSKGVQLVPKSPLYPARLHKSTAEAGYIRDALSHTYKAYQRIEEILSEATIDGELLKYQGAVLTSEFVRAEVEQVLLRDNMFNLEGMIISCAKQAAIPHHRGAGPLLAHQTIICDIFPKDRTTGYFADMTRTYVKGQPSEYMQRMYDAVLQAQETAIAHIKPGVRMGDIHQLCVDVFEAAGFHSGDKGFIHGTGHGLGLDIHESPYVKAGIDARFEPGHVVTVEPGLYYPEHGGVRIEDVVWVTEDGCDNLTSYHKQFIID